MKKLIISVMFIAVACPLQAMRRGYVDTSVRSPMFFSGFGSSAGEVAPEAFKYDSTISTAKQPVSGVFSRQQLSDMTYFDSSKFSNPNLKTVVIDGKRVTLDLSALDEKPVGVSVSDRSVVSSAGSIDMSQAGQPGFISSLLVPKFNFKSKESGSSSVDSKESSLKVSDEQPVEDQALVESTSTAQQSGQGVLQQMLFNPQQMQRMMSQLKPANRASLINILSNVPLGKPLIIDRGAMLPSVKVSAVDVTLCLRMLQEPASQPVVKGRALLTSGDIPSPSPVEVATKVVAEPVAPTQSQIHDQSAASFYTQSRGAFDARKSSANPYGQSLAVPVENAWLGQRNNSRTAMELSEADQMGKEDKLAASLRSQDKALKDVIPLEEQSKVVDESEIRIIAADTSGFVVVKNASTFATIKAALLDIKNKILSAFGFRNQDVSPEQHAEIDGVVDEVARNFTEESLNSTSYSQAIYNMGLKIWNILTLKSLRTRNVAPSVVSDVNAQTIV